jgi:hypothetical protein
VLYPTIWAVSPLKFTITPNNVIDTIKITFPSNWTLETQSLSASVIGSPTCSSVSNPTLTCTYLSPSFTISNLYYYSAGTPIDVTISSINNPSACINAGSISLYLSANGAVVEQALSFTIAAAFFSNDILRNPSAVLTYQPSDKLQVQLNFQFAELNVNTDKIYITFPSELSIPLTSASYTIKMATATVSPTLTFNASGNTVSFNVSSTSNYQIAVVVIVTGIARPRESKNTSSFTIRTYRSNIYLMDLTTCCSLQLANRQTLTINSIALSNSQHLQTAVDYTFTFTTSVVNLITTDAIQVLFPPEYSAFFTTANTATLCGAVTITSTNNPALLTTPTCAIYMNYLLLTSFLTGSLPGS